MWFAYRTYVYARPSYRRYIHSDAHRPARYDRFVENLVHLRRGRTSGPAHNKTTLLSTFPHTFGRIAVTAYVRRYVFGVRNESGTRKTGSAIDDDVFTTRPVPRDKPIVPISSLSRMTASRLCRAGNNDRPFCRRSILLAVGPIFFRCRSFSSCTPFTCACARNARKPYTRGGGRPKNKNKKNHR